MLQNRKARRSRQCQINQPVQLFAEISAISAALTCKTRHAPSRQEHPERWPSGLRRTLGKRVCGKPYRGFESHSLRQVTQDGVFSGQIRWQISPVAVEISNLELWTPNRQNRPIVLRKAGFSPNL